MSEPLLPLHPSQQPPPATARLELTNEAAMAYVNLMLEKVGPDKFKVPPMSKSIPLMDIALRRTRLRGPLLPIVEWEPGITRVTFDVVTYELADFEIGLSE